MFVKLPNGDELHVLIKHEHFIDSRGKPQPLAWLSGNVKKKQHTTIRVMTHRTICEISDAKTHRLLAMGVAKCSDDDQFVKRTGSIVSLRKATEALDREARRQIWTQFMRPKDRAISPAPA